MVRWRYCLFLAMLLLLPVRAGSKLDDDDDDAESGQPDVREKSIKKRGGYKYGHKTFPSRRSEDSDTESDEEDEEDDEEPPTEKTERSVPGRRVPPVLLSTVSEPMTRTLPRRPLECYVCAYKAETHLQSCLDPSKYRVHTMICHSAEDKCFTTVISKGNTYEAVLRGCRSGCVGNTETTCCELNRCNNQALAMPALAAPHVLTVTGKSNKTIPPSVLFFVTILLVVQTVVKVAIV